MPRTVKIFFHIKANATLIRADVFPRIAAFIKDQGRNSSINFSFIADAVSEIQRTTIQQLTRQLLANSSIAGNFISVIATPFDLVTGRLSPASLQKIVANFEENPAQVARLSQALVTRLSHKPINSFGNDIEPQQKNTVEFLLRELLALPPAKEISPLGLLYAAMMFGDCDSSTLVISEELAVIFSCFKARIKFLQDKHQKIRLLGLHVGHGTALYQESDWLQIQEFRTEANLINLIERSVAIEDKNFYSFKGRRGDLIARLHLPVYSGGETEESFKRDIPRNRFISHNEVAVQQWLQAIQNIQQSSNDYSQGDFTGASDVGLIWNRLVLSFPDPGNFSLTLTPTNTLFSFVDEQKKPAGVSIWKWHENLWMMAIVQYADDARCFSDGQVTVFFNAPVKHMMNRLLQDQAPVCQVINSRENLLQNISEQMHSKPHMELLSRYLFNKDIRSIALFQFDGFIGNFLNKENGMGVIKIVDVGSYSNIFSHKLVGKIEDEKRKANGKKYTFEKLIETVAIAEQGSHFYTEQLKLEIKQHIQLFKFLLDINNNSNSSSSSSSSSVAVDESGIAPDDKIFLTEHFQMHEKSAQVVVLKALHTKIGALIVLVGSNNFDKHYSDIYEECVKRYQQLSYLQFPRLEAKTDHFQAKSPLRQSESVIESAANATPIQPTFPASK